MTALATTSVSQYTITSGANTYKTVTLDPALNVTSGVTVSYDPLRAMANAGTSREKRLKTCMVNLRKSELQASDAPGSRFGFGNLVI